MVTLEHIGSTWGAPAEQASQRQGEPFEHADRYTVRSRRGLMLPTEFALSSRIANEVDAIAA